jgi:hypothetical protein
LARPLMPTRPIQPTKILAIDGTQRMIGQATL